MPPRFYEPQWLSHLGFMKISKSSPHEGPRQAPISQNAATHLSLSLVLYLDASPQSLSRHTGFHSSPTLSSNAENFWSDIFAQTTHSAYPTGHLISLANPLLLCTPKLSWGFVVSAVSQVAWINAQTSLSLTPTVKTLLLWLLFSPHTPEA